MDEVWTIKALPINRPSDYLAQGRTLLHFHTSVLQQLKRSGGNLLRIVSLQHGAEIAGT